MVEGRLYVCGSARRPAILLAKQRSATNGSGNLWALGDSEHIATVEFEILRQPQILNVNDRGKKFLRGPPRRVSAADRSKLSRCESSGLRSLCAQERANGAI